jgi:hypothetical protein
MAVVALAMHPTRQADRLADVAKAKRSAIVGTIGVHREVVPSEENCGEKRAPRFKAGKLFVNPRGPR